MDKTLWVTSLGHPVISAVTCPYDSRLGRKDD